MTVGKYLFIVLASALQETSRLNERAFPVNSAPSSKSSTPHHISQDHNDNAEAQGKVLINANEFSVMKAGEGGREELIVMLIEL